MIHPLEHGIYRDFNMEDMVEKKDMAIQTMAIQDMVTQNMVHIQGRSLG